MRRKADLQRRLSRVDAPREAEERAWETVRSSYSAREPVPTRRRPGRPIAVLALALGITGLALSPAGAEVGEWVRDTFDRTTRERSVGLERLPGAGRLLTTLDGAAWSVDAHGARRRLGAARDARWSPYGRFVTLAGPDGLRAVDPGGQVRWAVDRPSVRSPVWSAPDGYRIAYRSGSTLRVIAGDGTGDRLLAGKIAPVAAAWRPKTHVLAFVRADGMLVMRDVDTERTLWTASAPRRPRLLAWRAGGDRLVVVGADAVVAFDAAGRTRARRFLGRSPGDITAAALAPRGTALALLRWQPREATSSLVVLEGGRSRTVTSVAGRFSDIVWSPDGRWLLVSWPTADQWLAVRSSGRPRLVSVSRIGARFGSPPGEAARFRGWCCPTEPRR